MYTVTPYRPSGRSPAGLPWVPAIHSRLAVAANCLINRKREGKQAALNVQLYRWRWRVLHAFKRQWTFIRLLQVGSLCRPMLYCSDSQNRYISAICQPIHVGFDVLKPAKCALSTFVSVIDSSACL